MALFALPLASASFSGRRHDGMALLALFVHAPGSPAPRRTVFDILYFLFACALTQDCQRRTTLALLKTEAL